MYFYQLPIAAYDIHRFVRKEKVIPRVALGVVALPATTPIMKSVLEWLKTERLHKYWPVFSRMNYQTIVGLTDDNIDQALTNIAANETITHGARGRVLRCAEFLRARPSQLDAIDGKTPLDEVCQIFNDVLDSPLSTASEPYGISLIRKISEKLRFVILRHGATVLQFKGFEEVLILFANREDIPKDEREFARNAIQNMHIVANFVTPPPSPPILSSPQHSTAQRTPHRQSDPKATKPTGQAMFRNGKSVQAKNGKPAQASGSKNHWAGQARSGVPAQESSSRNCCSGQANNDTPVQASSSRNHWFPAVEQQQQQPAAAHASAWNGVWNGRTWAVSGTQQRVATHQSNGEVNNVAASQEEEEDESDLFLRLDSLRSSINRSAELPRPMVPTQSLCQDPHPSVQQTSSSMHPTCSSGTMKKTASSNMQQTTIVTSSMQLTTTVTSNMQPAISASNMQLLHPSVQQRQAALQQLRHRQTPTVPPPGFQRWEHFSVNPVEPSRWACFNPTSMLPSYSYIPLSAVAPRVAAPKPVVAAPRPPVVQLPAPQLAPKPASWRLPPRSVSQPSPAHTSGTEKMYETRQLGWFEPTRAPFQQPIDEKWPNNLFEKSGALQMLKASYKPGPSLLGALLDMNDTWGGCENQRLPDLSILKPE